MEEIYTNKFLNYGYISALTLLLLIIIINVFLGNFTKFTGNVLLSENNIKLVILLITFTTYLTLVIPSIRMIAQKQIKFKKPPRGKKGPRGNRGKSGKAGGCTECGDDLCYKKIFLLFPNDE